MFKGSKGDHTIESRIVSVEVYCGPVKNVFTYRTDALMGGGANIMIEIMRQSMIDLCSVLRELGLTTPKICWLQFDNCGENKNKEMMTYLSLLIETFIFDTIEMCFLIVGHTHASIDQYFSVISKAIKRAHFIGSPLGLLEVIRRAHEKTWIQKPIIRDLTVYYDVKTALAPYINTKIKHYQVPHCFLFTPSFGRKAIMKYKMFSGNTHWLPIEPEGIMNSLDLLESHTIQRVDFPNSLAVVNGQNKVLEFLGYNNNRDNSSNVNVLDDRSSLNAMTQLTSVMSDLEKLSLDSVMEQQQRMDEEAEGIRITRTPISSEFMTRVQKEMKSLSNANRGYIMWIDLVAKKNQPNLPDINTIQPALFDPAYILDHLDTLKSSFKISDEDNDDDDGEAVYGLASSTTAPLTHRTEQRAVDVSVSQKMKLVNAAKEIAGSSRAILSQIGTRFTVSASRGFDDLSFKSNVLTIEEQEYYQARNSTKKVIQLAADAYRNAPAWSPLPIIALSAVDIKRIEEEQQLHKEKIEKANQIGRQLLVRVGADADATQELIVYGMPNNNYISEQLREKKRKTPKPAANELKKRKLTEEVYCCDVKGCLEPAKTSEKVCDIEACKKKYRFCQVAHATHVQHQLPKRSKREKFFKPAISVTATSGVPVAVSHVVDTTVLVSETTNIPHNTTVSVATSSELEVLLPEVAESSDEADDSEDSDESDTSGACEALEADNVVGETEDSAAALVVNSTNIVVVSGTSVDLESTIMLSDNVNVISDVDSHFPDGIDVGFATFHHKAFKLWKIVNKSVAAEKMRKKGCDIAQRIFTELNYPMYMNDLKLLVKEVYRFELKNESGDDYTTLDLGNRKSREAFIKAFAKKYIDTNK